MEKAGFGSEEVDVRWAAAETRMGETFEARMWEKREEGFEKELKRNVSWEGKEWKERSTLKQRRGSWKRQRDSRVVLPPPCLVVFHSPRKALPRNLSLHRKTFFLFRSYLCLQFTYNYRNVILLKEK